MPATYPPILEPGTVTDGAFWSAAANQAVRSYCGWHVAPVITETLVLDGSGGESLLLPSQRIVQLLEATNDGEDVLEKVKWSHRSGVIWLERLWSEKVGSVTVRLEHGYDLADVPDVQAVIASVQARAASAPAGVVSQSVGAASVRYATDGTGAPASVPLLGSEMRTLSRYALTWGV